MNWRKWIRPGVVVTALAALIAVFVQRGHIERELVARVSEALAASGQTWAVASASGRDVVISGVAPAPEAEETAVRIAQGVSGVRAVADATTLLPTAAPYVWSARRAGRQVTISGNVPSEGARASILAAARRAVPQAEIVDRMALARGASPSFALATAFAMGRLPALSEGLVTLTDAMLSVSGTAVDFGGLRSLPHLARARRAGVGRDRPGGGVGRAGEPVRLVDQPRPRDRDGCRQRPQRGRARNARRDDQGNASGLDDC